MPREGRKKWWFEHKSGKVFVYRGNGPISHRSEELADVVRIDYSENVDDKVKVSFRNKLQPLLLNLPSFDFSANEWSKRFKSVLSSPLSFSKQFKTLLSLNEELQSRETLSTDTAALNSSLEGTSAPRCSTPTNSSTDQHLSTPATTSQDATPTTSHDATPTTSHDATPTTSHDATPTTSQDVTPQTSHDATPATLHDGTPQTSHGATPATLHGGTPQTAQAPKRKGEKRKRVLSNGEENAQQSPVLSDKEFELNILQKMAIAGGG